MVQGINNLSDITLVTKTNLPQPVVSNSFSLLIEEIRKQIYF